MTTKHVVIAAMAIAASVLVSSCGTSNVAKTPQQKASAARGVQLEKEECEELALKESKGWRSSGNGASAKEAFAKSIAELNAKTRLARQLEEQINTLIRSFNQQHESGNATALTGKSSEIAEGYTDKLLTNVRTICSNTYVKEDGTYNVYVCVEMSEEGLAPIRKALTEDQKLSIDFAEDQFKKEMEKAKEDFRNRE
jgi:hypothetical protein